MLLLLLNTPFYETNNTLNEDARKRTCETILKLTTNWQAFKCICTDGIICAAQHLRKPVKRLSGKQATLNADGVVADFRVGRTVSTKHPMSVQQGSNSLHVGID